MVDLKSAVGDVEASSDVSLACWFWATEIKKPPETIQEAEQC
jgi:hypothetical protein